MTSTIEQSEYKNPLSIPTSVIVATWLLIEWAQEQTQISYLDKEGSEGAFIYVKGSSEKDDSR